MSHQNTNCPYCGSEDYDALKQVKEPEWTSFNGQTRKPKVVTKFYRRCRNCSNGYVLFISVKKGK